MSNKMKYNFIFMFLFYFILLCLSPISGDDWGNYLVGKTGLYHSIGNAIGMYFDWEGRFFSRVLINILTCHKLLWNLVNSFTITFLLYLIVKIIGFDKKKSIYFFIFLIIPFMNIYMFSQTITWIAGNLTYFFEIPFIILYFLLLSKGKYHKGWFWLNFIFCLILPMFVEHMAIIVVLGSLFFLVYYYFKNKKIDFRIVIFSLISICSTCLMLLSPGTAYRSSVENVDFNNLSIIGKFMFNLPSFIYYTFVSNYYLIFLIVISSFYMIKKQIKNNFKYCLLLFFLISPILVIINFLFKMGSFYNLLLIIYFILFMIGYFVLLIRNGKCESIFFFVFGIFSNLVMMMSPTWGFRTGLFTYVFLCISCFIIISENYKGNIIFDYCLKYGYLFLLSLFMVLYINVFICQKDLKDSIKMQVANNDSIIKITRFPNYINCNINPDNEYHLSKFKEYYGIPQEKDIEFINGKWNFIIYKK